MTPESRLFDPARHSDPVHSDPVPNGETVPNSDPVPNGETAPNGEPMRHGDPVQHGETAPNGETVPHSGVVSDAMSDRGSGADGGATGGAGPGRRRRPRRVRVAIVSGGTVLALGAVTATAFGVGGGDDAKPAATGLPPATAAVERTTLIQTQLVTGTLGYGADRALNSKAAGTLTWLPNLGTRLGRGATVLRADDKPVVLLHGDLPLYRPLAPKTEGADVRQFETNLRALGYKGFTVDNKYTDSTAKAVKKWQKALKVAETGTVDPAAAIVVPGDIRVTEHKMTVGDPAGGTVLSYAGTTRVVTIDLNVKYQELVRKGAAVTVSLPSGQSAKGTITSIGTVATAPSGEGEESKATIPVTVTVTDAKALGSYDRAPVDVELVADERKDVLAVPVGALLALAEGGYGVEIVSGTTTRIVRVRTGMFASGKVEVSGDALTEGVKVGVPA